MKEGALAALPLGTTDPAGRDGERDLHLDPESYEPGADLVPAGGDLDLAFDRRTLLTSWYVPLLAGVLPALLLGFGYSAIADRIVFVFWGLAVAAGWVVLLRQGLASGWPAAWRWGSLLLLAATGAAVFGLLERRHHEILDLGFRAVLPGLYTPAATRPATALVLAAALAAAGTLAATILRRRA